MADLLQKEKTPGRLVFTRNPSVFTRSGEKKRNVEACLLKAYSHSLCSLIIIDSSNVPIISTEIVFITALNVSLHLETSR